MEEKKKDEKAGDLSERNGSCIQFGFHLKLNYYCRRCSVQRPQGAPKKEETNLQGIGEKLRPEIARNIRIENWRVKTKSVIELSPDTNRAGENETCVS